MTEITKTIYVEVPVTVRVGYTPETPSTHDNPYWAADAMPGEVLNMDEIKEKIDLAIMETDWLEEISDDLDVLAEDVDGSLDFDEIPSHIFADNFA